jgi:two-component system chemotaxis response regulator CheB
MLNSLVDIYSSKLLFVMLTGMGNDGLLAAKNVAGKGGNVFAQDKETSVVWGMPGAVAKAGICSKVAPITDLARDIMGRF